MVASRPIEITAPGDLFVFKFIELLYDELDIPVAFILPGARFAKLLVPSRFGEIDSEETGAGDVAERLLKRPYQSAGVVSYNRSRCLGLLFVGKGGAMPEPKTYG